MGLGRPVDAASLAVFRIGLGLAGALLMVRLWWNGWLSSLYAAPVNHLRYPGLGWLPEVPDGLVHIVAAVALIGALGVTIGWRHRIGAAVFAGAFGLLEATEATTYLNHYWLLTYLYVLAAFLPLSATFSVRARTEGLQRSVPIGSVWLLRCQMVLVYFFAGLAKLNWDWLQEALPLRIWLPARADLPLVGRFLDDPVTAIVLAWAGLVFDLGVGFALLSRRVRRWAFIAVVMFHIATWLLFPSIGIFPLLMIVAALVFFDPEWPRRLGPAFFHSIRHRTTDKQPPAVRWGALATAMSALWLVVQLLLPLRHLLIPGDARFTGEGYLFAWNVLAIEKAGSVSFRVTDVVAGTTWIDDVSDLYSPAQIRVAAAEPHLILQMAHGVADAWQGSGRVIEVRADAFVSINGRSDQRLIDPEVDLAALPVDAALGLYVGP